MTDIFIDEKEPDLLADLMDKADAMARKLNFIYHGSKEHPAVTAYNEAKSKLKVK